jgi:hypothetical protein
VTTSNEASVQAKLYGPDRGPLGPSRSGRIGDFLGAVELEAFYRAADQRFLRMQGC